MICYNDCTSACVAILLVHAVEKVYSYSSSVKESGLKALSIVEVTFTYLFSILESSTKANLEKIKMLVNFTGCCQCCQLLKLPF